MVLLVAMASAACPASPGTLEADAARVERAFAALDAPGVASAGAALERDTACAEAPVERGLAVRVHAAAGLVAFVAGDTDHAAAAFAAARRLDPSWAPDPALVPKGHPIRSLAAREVPSGIERADRPARGTLYFDGEATLERPRDTATVAQWVVGDEVVAGAYVWPSAPLPPYDAARKGPRRSLGAWLGVAGAGLAASATCFYVAGRARDAWENAETGPEVEAHYLENNVLFGAGAAFGVVAGVGSVGAVAALAF